MNPYLSVVVPAFNEAARIEPTLTEVLAYLDKQPYTWEVIVVDDGSTDGTFSVAQKFGDIKILRNEHNKGKGYSVKRGMIEARGDCRLFMDADHSVRIENLTRFLGELKGGTGREGTDIVIASIEVDGSSIEDDNYGYRRIFGKVAKWLIRTLATPGIYDTQRGFKLFTGEASRTLFPLLCIDRWGFDFELLRLAQRRGMRIKELPVVWKNSKATAVTMGSYVRTLWELLRII